MILPDDDIILGVTYLHEETKRVYVTLSFISEFKADGIWWGKCVTYQKLNNPQVVYGRTIDDFKAKFTRTA